LSNGTSKTLSVTIRKQYNAQTDYLNEKMHERLVIALNHDTVTIEGDRYIGGVSVDGDYEITWPDFLDYPLGQAAVKLQVTPFDMTNDNCQTCEEASQLSLVDDGIGEIEQGEAKPMNVFANDNICCFPLEAEIVSFATGYLDSATIDATTGVATLTAKDPSTPVGDIVLATYRVTCPDGSYDEADIIGSIAGTGDACEQPGGFDPPVYSLDLITVDMEWATPAVDPPGGYEWQLYEMQTPGTPVLTGTTSDKTITIGPLQYGTDYGFYVRSVCDGPVYSPYSEFLFTTPSSGRSNCGSFDVSANDGGIEANIYNYSYMGCDGNIVNSAIVNLSTQSKCMLINPDNSPVYFETSDPSVTINYVEEC
jgi:hypothetical protein